MKIIVLACTVLIFIIIVGMLIIITLQVLHTIEDNDIQNQNSDFSKALKVEQQQHNKIRVYVIQLQITIKNM